MPRWKIGDKVTFDTGEGIMIGEIREVIERVPNADDLYGIKWEDGFEDGEGNIFPEWELNDAKEVYLG